MYKYRKVDKSMASGLEYEIVHEIESETEAGLLYGMQILNYGDGEGEEELIGENVQH